MLRLLAIPALLFGVLTHALMAATPPVQIPALVVDGRSNHDWAALTPVLKQQLEATHLFTVDVATAPASNDEMKSFAPPFGKYKVVVLNYTDFGNGGLWPEQTQQAFLRYVSAGGGVVVFHASLSAFPQWQTFNQIIGLGGWGGRDEHSGPYVYFADDKQVTDTTAGPGGHHGPRHPFPMKVRQANHPITSGLPRTWLHPTDELYDHLRGPAQNLTILATAYSDKKFAGTGHDEPMLFTVRYGKGRIVGIATGHGDAASALDSAVMLQRGAEWSATGGVTQKPLSTLDASPATQGAHP